MVIIFALPAMAGAQCPTEDLDMDGVPDVCPTGSTYLAGTDALRNAFSEAAFDSDAETIGEAMIRAHQAASGAPLPLHQVYMLLGDPARRLGVRARDRSDWGSSWPVSPWRSAADAHSGNRAATFIDTPWG